MEQGRFCHKPFIFSYLSHTFTYTFGGIKTSQVSAVRALCTFSFPNTVVQQSQQGQQRAERLLPSLSLKLSCSFLPAVLSSFFLSFFCADPLAFSSSYSSFPHSLPASTHPFLPLRRFFAVFSLQKSFFCLIFAVRFALRTVLYNTVYTWGWVSSKVLVQQTYTYCHTKQEVETYSKENLTFSPRVVLMILNRRVKFSVYKYIDFPRGYGTQNTTRILTVQQYCTGTRTFSWRSLVFASQMAGDPIHNVTRILGIPLQVQLYSANCPVNRANSVFL